MKAERVFSANVKENRSHKQVDVMRVRDERVRESESERLQRKEAVAALSALGMVTCSAWRHHPSVRGERGPPPPTPPPRPPPPPPDPLIWCCFHLLASMRPQWSRTSSVPQTNQPFSICWQHVFLLESLHDVWLLPRQSCRAALLPSVLLFVYGDPH